MSDFGWHDRAACRGVPLVVFFGHEGESRAAKRGREEYARSICSQCSVRAECLQWALDSPEAFGTWGGLDEDTRKAERRRRMRRDVSARARRVSA